MALASPFDHTLCCALSRAFHNNMSRYNARYTQKIQVGVDATPSWGVCRGWRNPAPPSVRHGSGSQVADARRNVDRHTGVDIVRSQPVRADAIAIRGTRMKRCRGPGSARSSRDGTVVANRAIGRNDGKRPARPDGFRRYLRRRRGRSRSSSDGGTGAGLALHRTLPLAGTHRMRYRLATRGPDAWSVNE